MNQGTLFSGDFREKARGVSPLAEQMLVDSGWRPPEQLPNPSGFAGAKLISVDIESHDPELHSYGPGFIRGDAHAIGVAVAVQGRDDKIDAWYLPFRHLRPPNFPAEVVVPWLKEVAQLDVPKLGANFLYDLEGLAVEGVRFRGDLFDIQNAEGLIDEESATIDNWDQKGFTVDALSRKYLGEEKLDSYFDDPKLKALLKLRKKGQSAKGHLRDLPAWAGVGPYAEMDAILNIKVFEKQQLELDRQELNDIWKLETALVPLLLEMRLRGVRADVERAHQVSKQLTEARDKYLDELKQIAGRRVDPNKNEDLVWLAKGADVDVMYTPRGNPSFTADWLKDQDHPVFAKVLECRQVEKQRRDFVEGIVIKRNINGRLHPQFHQLRRAKEQDDSGEDGTRSGRFSSTNFNAQQITARHPVYGPLIRSLFVPDEGGQWTCADYSGQEPALTVHYASLINAPGSAEAVEYYNTAVKPDYHQMVSDMTNLPRKQAKKINLMLTYGAGKKTMAWKMGLITEMQFVDREYKLAPEVDAIFDQYHGRLPFAKVLVDRCERLALDRGFVRTLLGRLRHFELWGPKWSPEYGQPKGLPYKMALDNWPGLPLVRTDCRKALNALVQGSAADMIKKAVLDLWRQGHVPHLLVHDEINSTTRSPEEHKMIVQTMVEAVKLHVRVFVDAKQAANWGEAK